MKSAFTIVTIALLLALVGGFAYRRATSSKHTNTVHVISCVMIPYADTPDELPTEAAFYTLKGEDIEVEAMYPDALCSIPLGAKFVIEPGYAISTDTLTKLTIKQITEAR